MIKLLVLLILAPSLVFASTMEEVENYFQKGMQYSQQGMEDEAINEFYKVVNSDPANLPSDYYVQTYSEAFFDIGVLYGKKGNNQEAIDNFKKAIHIFPEHKRALYYLAGMLINDGEIAEAKLYYERAKELGYTKDTYNALKGDFVGEHLNIIKEQELKLELEYKSSVDSDKKIIITIKGYPIGDEALIKDTIAAIEKQSIILGYKYITPIFVERIRQKEGNTIIVEKWIVGEKENSKEFWIKYDFTPPPGFPYKIMILISETEPGITDSGL
ncbi:MAG: tetratricopeptide repeat protein [Candidatus Omnitrophota bacterium]